MDLSQIFNYDPDTGILTRKIRTGVRTQIGDIAGTTSKDGYRYTRANGKKMRNTHIIWTIMKGNKVPSGYQVDHKDRDRLNDKWDNLRLVTPSQNCHNATIRKDNKSGYKGVSFYKQSGTWRAVVNLNGKQYSAGYHATAELAFEAICIKRNELHGEYASHF
jgi:hypothetical protein